MGDGGELPIVCGCGILLRAPFSARITEEEGRKAKRRRRRQWAVGTGVEGRALLLSARRAPPLRAANGIDSIKRRGNEERESEATPSPPPPSAMLSRQRGTKEKELLGDCLPRLPRSQGESLHGSCKILT